MPRSTGVPMHGVQAVNKLVGKCHWGLQICMYLSIHEAWVRSMCHMLTWLLCAVAGHVQLHQVVHGHEHACQAAGHELLLPRVKLLLHHAHALLQRVHIATQHVGLQDNCRQTVPIWCWEHARVCKTPVLELLLGMQVQGRRQLPPAEHMQASRDVQ